MSDSQAKATDAHQPTTATISVALCTYNGAQHLPAQLASIAGQTRQPDELLVCDDVSDDFTIEVIESFAHNVPFPVRVFINNEKLGAIKNFEKAVSLCTGDILFLSDQDDV